MKGVQVLTFDPGSLCGWAFGKQDSEDGVCTCLESGCQEFDLRRGESPGMRFWRFRDWLAEIMAAMRLNDLVLFEQAHHRGGAATELTVGMSTRIMEEATRRGCEYKAVHTATLKKSLTGSGRADKADMAYAVDRHMPSLSMGVERTSHEWDALALLAWFNLGMPEAASKRKKRQRKGVTRERTT